MKRQNTAIFISIALVITLTISASVFSGCKAFKESEGGGGTDNFTSSEYSSGQYYNSGIESLKKADEARKSGNETQAVEFENKAETSFTKAIEADWRNQDARIALSSMLAKKAGITISDIEESILMTGSLLDIEKPSQKVQKVAETFEDAVKLPDNDIDPVPTARVFRKSGTDLVIVIATVLDDYRHIANIDSKNLQNFEKAIALLRYTDHALQDKKPKLRVRLATLSIVRLVQWMRILVNAKKLEPNKTPYDEWCSKPKTELFETFIALRESINWLNEGLSAPKDSDVSSYYERARENLAALSNKLKSNLIVEKLSVDDADSKLNASELAAVKLVVEKLCK